MRTLLIGALGQLGTDLRGELTGEVFSCDWPELDIRDAAAVTARTAECRPDVVLNCAAYTNVDACEDEPAEAFAVNALGALHVARAAEQVGAALVYISTDYVFGAAGPRPMAYAESDTPGPVNVYGASKLAGEHLSLTYNRRALVARTCGLYGHAGARGKGGNFVETILKLATTRPVLRVVADQVLTPTSTRGCARKLVELIAHGARGIVHVAAADACSWYDFAAAIVAGAGLNAEVQPIRTDEYPTKARRPAMSALRGTRWGEWGLAGCPSWRDMLSEYLRTRPAPP